MSKKTIKEALKEASLTLENKKEATLLLQHLLGYDQVQIILKENEPLKELDSYQKLINRRLNNEPIEYITQKVSFYSEEFFIKQGALIPRPETEILVDKALEIVKEKSYKIAEIGVGSGIVSIMLALLVKDIEIVATDISQDALDIAKTNAEKFGVSDKINFVHTSYLDDIYDSFDMIISNPPYIADGFKLEKPLSFEPQNALFGGKVGDEMLKKIISLYKKSDANYLLCEMGYDQKDAMATLLKDEKIEFYKDLAGFDRGFVAQKGVY
jgi:release factor glutamine methyltransferase